MVTPAGVRIPDAPLKFYIMNYQPNKKYYVVGARNAWDTVPVGLFDSFDSAHGSFPLSSPDIIREATRLEIINFFKLNEHELPNH